MTDLVAVALVGGCFSFLASFLSFLQYLLGKKTDKTVNILEKSTNGKMDELLRLKATLRESAVDAAFHKGVLEGIRLAKHHETS